MTPNARIMTITIFISSLVWLATSAAVELRFSPQVQDIGIDETGEIAIMLDDPIEVRTIEVTVQFDPDLLETVDGGQGSAFQDLPCSIWEEFTPGDGEWYGFAVSLGADCFLVGPGELFRWEFTTIGVGTSPITAVSVVLADEFADIIEDVTLPDGAVIVGDGVSATDLGPDRPTILAQPNPCNPTTSIRFALPAARDARLDLFDVEGRRVCTLLDGFVPAGWSSVRWDGRADDGAAVPSGVYLYRLITGHEQLSGRVTLAR